MKLLNGTNCWCPEGGTGDKDALKHMFIKEGIWNQSFLLIDWSAVAMVLKNELIFFHMFNLNKTIENFTLNCCPFVQLFLFSI